MTVQVIGFEPAAVLLDMDGLMLDSERVQQEVAREACDRLGLEVEDAFWLSMVGLHESVCNRMIAERFGQAHADALLRLRDEAYDERIAAGLPVKPGVRELLRMLAAYGVPHACVTSTRRTHALRKLEAVDLLGHFEVVVTGSDIEHPKPAPDIYLLAAERLGVDPVRCVAVEDSVPGVRAALAAGVTPIQVPDLVPPDDQVRALGHRIVDTLSHAMRLIEPALQGRRTGTG